MMVILLCIAALAALLLGAWQLLSRRRKRSDHKGMVATMPVVPVNPLTPVPITMAPPVQSTPTTLPQQARSPNDALVHSLTPDELEALPFFLRPGHGFLLLLDCCLDRLEIDAIDIGHPHHTHAHRDVDFRGYFNVTPGTHALTAHWQGRSTTQTLEVAPDRVYVVRLDWAHGGWVEVPPHIAAAQGALTMSLLETRRLQPWPLPSLYFLNPPQPLWVNDKLLPITEFGGLIDMPPGNVHIRAGTHTACWTLPPKCMQVVTFENNSEPELLDPRVSAVVVSRELRTAPRSALISHAQLLAQPVDLGLFATDSAVANAAADPEDIFDTEDLDYFDQMFEDYRLQGTGGLTNYIAVLHAHYVSDAAMAYQAEFFEGYAERAYAHITIAPQLLQTQAGYYLRSLASDLQTTKVDALETLGRQLQVLVANYLRVA